ncbi:MAG TPA: 16S rRNA (adenine(1518)-N(6)/adenine(1519)-N(6))-dimethyltransferase RsmA [Candidatus Paceibacterota bacterium]
MPQKLGQHFLTNASAAAKIIDALDLKPKEVIVEIGPGKGVLTEELRIRNEELRIIGIEKDKSLARELRQKYTDSKNIEIMEGDVLKLLPSIIHDSSFSIQNYKLIGNIPYYITGKILRILTESEFKPKIAVLTLQKEVAERIAAHQPSIHPTHRKCSMCGMNLLAAIVQFTFDVEIISYLDKRNFNPIPKVDSAVIRLLPKNHESRIRNEEYFRFVRILFKQPRKTLTNNLRYGYKLETKDILKKIGKLGLKGGERPQDLALETIKALALNFI